MKTINPHDAYRNHQTHNHNGIAPHYRNTTMKRTTYPRAILLLPLLMLALAGLWGIAGCGGGANEGHQAHDDHSGHDHEDEGRGHAAEGEGHGHQGEEGIITVTPATMTEAEIRTAPVTAGRVSSRFSLPAVVVPAGDRLARVGAIIPGRVAKLYAAEGSYVAKGTRLAEIETMEIGKVRAEYLKAVAAETRARQGLQRQQRLAGDGVGAQRTLEEATAEFETATALRKEAEAHLRSLGIDPQDAGSSFANRLVVHAPIDGHVSRRHVTLGEHIDPEDDLFTLVNTGTVWVDAQGTPAQAGMLGVGGMAAVRSQSGERMQGRIIFISPTADPDSRTVTVRVEIPNRGGAFRPGGFATAEFESGKSANMLVVPAEAVEQEGSRSFVYRVHEPGSFERVEVDVADKRDDAIVLGAGLEEGDEIAVSGIFYLRSIRMQGELSEHHH